MRGKEYGAISDYIGYGITPAYAGKSRMIESRRNIRRDHPRLCGEKWVLYGGFCSIRGSPPPMRGKDEVLTLFDAEPGITPAYAGKSVILSGDYSEIEDHPRLCGEKEG